MRHSSTTAYKMTVSELRQHVSNALLEFAWDEWTQMGVLAAAHRRSKWSADPEAHLLFALQIGRDEPRLFEEILDWWASNTRLISIQRFRNIFASRDDQRLGEAALAWVTRTGSRTRVAPRAPDGAQRAPEPLFYRQRPPSNPDQAFLEFGFAKPKTRRSHKSRTPDPKAPINFAFLLRQGLGVGSRAEIIRFLTTANAPSAFESRPLFTTLSIADAAGFAKRNVQDTLATLVEIGWIHQIVRGNEYLYEVDVERWRRFLGLDEFPRQRDWVDALHAFRALHRWLHEAELANYTPYMLSSEARRLMRGIEPSLGFAGIAVSAEDAPGERYWEAFVRKVDQMLASLAAGLAW